MRIESPPRSSVGFWSFRPASTLCRFHLNTPTVFVMLINTSSILSVRDYITSITTVKSQCLHGVTFRSWIDSAITDLFICVFETVILWKYLPFIYFQSAVQSFIGWLTLSVRPASAAICCPVLLEKKKKSFKYFFPQDSSGHRSSGPVLFHCELHCVNHPKSSSYSPSCFCKPRPQVHHTVARKGLSLFLLLLFFCPLHRWKETWAIYSPGTRCL